MQKIALLSPKPKLHSARSSVLPLMFMCAYPEFEAVLIIHKFPYSLTVMSPNLSPLVREGDELNTARGPCGAGGALVPTLTLAYLLITPYDSPLCHLPRLAAMACVMHLSVYWASTGSCR